MIHYLDIVCSLFLQAWYVPSLVFLTAIIYYFSRGKSTVSLETRDHYWWLIAVGFIVFLLLSPAYWLFGENAAHSFSDDVTHTLQTYLSSSHRGDSFNWTNSLTGGMDRWLLPNCYPWSLGRIYALFLSHPYQLYLLVIAINVVLVFVFSWKIQREILGMQRWACYLGSLVTVIIEGYWTGLYPDAHVSNGHGFAVIIVGVYWLTRFCRHRYFWLVAVMVGIAMAVGSWTPFHNLLPLLMTMGIWGLVFWGQGSWIKVFKANILILITVIVVLFPYFLAIKLLFAASGRSEVFRPTVNLSGLYLMPQMRVLLGMAVVGGLLRIYRQKIVQQVLVMFLGFSVLPLIAHWMEASRVMPSFRWQLFYAGNDAWTWMAAVFFLERIQREIHERWAVAGIACKWMMITACSTMIIFAWMDSLWMDLVSSYPAGNWKTLTDTSVSSRMKVMEPRLGRVVGIDDTNDMHFWGQFQGFESALGYTPFIDRRKTYFWWYTAMGQSLHGAYTAAFLSIPIPVLKHDKHLDFPIPLNALVSLDALKLGNVRWIVSHHPLYPMEGLQLVDGDVGRDPACTDEPLPLSRVDFNNWNRYWRDVGCIIKDYSYPRSLYFYHLEGALPRVYLATQVLPWPQGQIQVLSQQQLSFAVQEAAFVDLKEWKPYQGVNDSLVDIKDYHNDFIRLHIKAQQEVLVVLSTTLNSYWQIYIQGKQVPFFDVNGFQTGIWVTPGNKEAELIYCPPFRPGKHPLCSRGSK
ncbi:MAG: hypothetical protein HQL15_02205 [Candidatus Omnitrophica bacterium]|nr:hypothetical protein [Candidatus Omnitrophota bacterium]